MPATGHDTNPWHRKYTKSGVLAKLRKVTTESILEPEIRAMVFATAGADGDQEIKNRARTVVAVKLIADRIYEWGDVLDKEPTLIEEVLGYLSREIESPSPVVREYEEKFVQLFLNTDAVHRPERWRAVVKFLPMLLDIAFTRNYQVRIWACGAESFMREERDRIFERNMDMIRALERYITSGKPLEPRRILAEYHSQTYRRRAFDALVTAYFRYKVELEKRILEETAESERCHKEDKAEQAKVHRERRAALNVELRRLPKF